MDSMTIRERVVDNAPEKRDTPVKLDLDAPASGPFVFTDIVYDVVNKDRSENGSNYKRLIHGISGEFRPGEVTAIMGPSGSCKTTLLNLLVGRAQPGSLTSGSITYRGKERDPVLWP